MLNSAVPILFVANVETSAAFFRDRLGFAIDFLYGDPPFYGSVSCGAARLHLRFVHEPVFAIGVREREEALLSALIRVDIIADLFAEYQAARIPFAQQLREDLLHRTPSRSCKRRQVLKLTSCLSNSPFASSSQPSFLASTMS